MIERLQKAIDKFEAREQSVPQDERAADNPDYTRLLNVIQALKNYKVMCEKIEAKLDQLGV